MTEQQTRIRPGDRLVKPAVLRDRLGMSAMTEHRRRKADPEFPQPIDGKYIDREIDEYIAILASRPAPARHSPRRASATAA